MADESNNLLLALTADITAAYVMHNRVAVGDFSGLMKLVHEALSVAAIGQSPEAVAARNIPAVPIKRSVTPDYIVCLEDGLKFKSLKRHLRTKWNLTPEAYRARWGLPNSYPMVAPSYSVARSALAKAIGLGRAGRPTTRASGKPTPPGSPRATKS